MRIDQRMSPAQAARWWREQARKDHEAKSGVRTPETEYLSRGRMVIVEHDTRRSDCRGTPVTRWYRQAGFPG